MTLDMMVARRPMPGRRASRRFVAPCVRGGRIRARVDDVMLTWCPTPRRYEGWGLFEALDLRQAVVLAHAGPDEVTRWLEGCEQARVVLARRLEGRRWLAVPAGATGPPVVVNLVSDADAFDAVRARFDGAAWWYEGYDRGVDPRRAFALRAALAEGASPGEGLGADCAAAWRLASAPAMSDPMPWIVTTGVALADEHDDGSRRSIFPATG